MPLSAVSEFLIQTVGEFVLEVAGYFTGRVVIPLLTFGRVRVEPGRKGEWTTPKWHGLNKQPDGSYLASAEMGALLGLLFWGVVGVGYALYRSAS